MAFKRVRRRLSTLAAGSNHLRSRTTAETKSVSGSSITSTNSNEALANNEISDGQFRRHRRSITFDKLFTSDELREGHALVAKQNRSSVLAIYSEPAHGEFEGHKDRSASTNAVKQSALVSARAGTPTPAEARLLGLHSGSSSRRTTIFVGRPQDFSYQEHMVDEVDDDARRKNERSYYEALDRTRAARRRSMLRSVGKDDYLLARGANPRTGIVSPEIHSTTSSYEEIELLKQRGIVRPPKWRQKGDQWILGEPTPLPSPPKGSRVRHFGRPLRTPPRLTAIGHNHDNGSNRQAEESSASATTIPQVIPTPNDVPGTYPISPGRDFYDTFSATRSTSGPIIKRKPVGSPSKDNTDPAAAKHTGLQDTTDTALKTSFEIRVRSSSASEARGVAFDRPSDLVNVLGKGQKSAPERERTPHHTDREHVEIESSFLGHGPVKWLEHTPESKLSVPSRQEKELPCLPMSSGQYQSLASSQKKSAKSYSEETKTDNGCRPKGPRGGDPAYPFVRNKRMAIPPHQCPALPNIQVRQNANKPMMHVPAYDNSLSQTKMPPRSMRGAIGGPRPMQFRSVSENVRNASHLSTSAHATTSMNTYIPIHTATLQPRLQGRYHRMPLGSEMESQQSMDQTHYKCFYPNDSRKLVGSMNMSEPINVLQSRPRPLSRPQMPCRADAHIRSVPRTSLPHNRDMEVMENHRRRKRTGMSESGSSENIDVSAASISRFEISQKLLPSSLRPLIDDRRKEAVTDFRKGGVQLERPDIAKEIGSGQDDLLSQSSGLTRKCSRCRGGFVESSLHSTAGSRQTLISMPSLAIKDLQPKRTKDESARRSNRASDMGSSDNNVDLKDHNACCTKCCIVDDCHEGCLGHPSPLTSSVSGSTLVGGDDCHDVPVQKLPSVSIPSSTPPNPEKNKLSLVQGLRMRKTLRTRQSPDDGKTIRARCNALDTPPIELDSHPLSPGSFWGGEGAITAAKKALGTKNRTMTIPSIASEETPSVANPDEFTEGPKLMIPKIRNLRSRAESEGRSRNVSEASSMSHVTIASRSRNVSGASLLSIEIPDLFSNLGTINVSSLFEMLRLPFEAAAMWVQTHPEAQQWMRSGVEKGMDMGRMVAKTGGTVWQVSYVYSKTGKLKCKAPGGIGKLVMDSVRSAGYLLVFVAISLSVARVLGVLLGLFQGLFWIFRVGGWLLQNLGLGLLW